MRLYFLIIGFIMVSSCSPKELPTVIDITDQYVKLRASHQTTKQELEGLKTYLSEKYNVNMDLSGTTYFDTGLVRDFHCRLTTSEGRGGAFKAGLTNLQFIYYGFNLSIDNGVVSPISFGSYEASDTK